MNRRDTWAAARYDFAMRLLAAPPTYVGEWQSQKSVDAANLTYEIMAASFEMPMPETAEAAVRLVGPNLPWAEDHFRERVSGKPLNPPPSNDWWPFAQQGNSLHKAEEIFSHTYPERYWPKFANVGETRPNGRQVFVPHNGVRYEYGDLGDVVDLLRKSPYTRQAYLPVWFPEDTGSVSGQRVPCSLGYQFLIRETPAGKVINVLYTMRSCDFMRHLADDIYMTIRLAQWVRDMLPGEYDDDPDNPFAGMKMGKLYFQAGSLHIFEPDRVALAGIVRDMTSAYTRRLSEYASGNGGPTTDEA